jgi:type VI secretion system protein ImpL
MMKRIWLELTPRACFTAAAMLLGISLFWLRAPRLLINGHAPFAAPSVRVWLVVAFCTLGIASWGLGRLYRARRNRAPLGEPETARKREAAVSAADWGFGAALRFVGQGGPWWRLGRNGVYRLPWYVLLGPADSGKSALMRASGLAFAKGDHELSASQPGAPCQWWFADEAVLLEPDGTAVWHAQGQDGADRAGWRDFLRRLKRARPRYPLNGVLAAIDAAGLLDRDEGLRVSHAETLRSRLRDIERKLGMRVPVYVVVTQCDRLEGFGVYFSDLGQQGRGQVLGLTFPPDDDAQSEKGLKSFPRRFAEIARRLQQQLVDRIATGDGASDRAGIHGFPVQFEMLGPPLARFLQSAFGPSPYAPSAWLRGVYFTSAAQGAPARPQSASSLAARLRAAAPPPPHPGAPPRGYFIAGLLRQLIFRECGLAARRSAYVPRPARLRYGVPAAIVCCAVLIGGLIYTSKQHVQALVDRMGQATAQLATLARRGVRFNTPATLLPLLDAAGNLHAIAQDSRPLAGWWRPGFQEDRRLADVAQAKYLSILKRTMVPFIGHRVREQLRMNSLDAAQRYRALRVYLMLGTPRRFDAAAVLRWLDHDLHQAALTRRQHDALLTHARAILTDQGFVPDLPLDQGLIDRSRAALAGEPIVDRTLAQIRERLDDEMPAPLSLVQMGGVNAPLVLCRKSGRPLTDGIPAAYTLDGYRRYQALRDAELAVVEKDVWVLGGDAASQASTRRATLAAELDNAYFGRYIQAWDDLLGDVRLAPLSSSADGGALVKLLAGPDSPLRSLLQTAAAQTTLPAPAGADDPVAGGPPSAAAARAAAPVSQEAASVQGMPAETPEGWTRVNLHFDALHRLVARPVGGGASPLDSIQKSLNELGIFLQAVDAARQRGLPLPAGDGFDTLRTQAQGMPEPLRDMLLGLTDNAQTETFAKERARLNDLWRANVAPFCHAALDHRYPLDPYSGVDVTLDDFARLFGPGGLIDAFFQTNLQPYVDTTAKPWRWRPGAAAPRMPADVLFEFEQAAAIRAAFFPDGAKSLAVRFQLVPRSLDTGITRFRLRLNGQTLDYEHGPERPVNFQWPSSDGPQVVRVTYEIAGSDEPRAYTIEGSWALFRLLDRVDVSRMQADRFNVRFDLDGKDGSEATVQLDASSVVNPFGLAALRQFRCLDHL